MPTTLEKTAMDFPDMTSNPATSMLTLPVELHLEILGLLPAKDIQRVRRICKHFRDTVDTHKAALARPIIALHMDRIRNEVDFALNYKGVDFLVALQRYNSLRGIWYDFRRRFGLSTFCKLWIQQQPGMASISPTLDFPAYWMHEEYVWSLACRLTDIYVLHHYPQIETYIRGGLWVGELDRDNFLGQTDGEKPDDGGQAVLGDSSTRVSEYYDEVLNPETDDLPARINTSASAEKVDWVVTHRKTCPRPWEVLDNNWADRDSIIELNIYEPTALTQLLGVPLLPPANDDTFAYCVSTEWAHKQIEKADGDGPLDVLLKAAILEELYLH